MANPTVAQLINPAPLVEAGLKSRFDVQIPEAPCLVQRSTDDLPAAYIAVQFALGTALSRFRPMPNGTFQRDAWNYTLQAIVQTVRVAGQPDTLAPLVGRVTELILESRYDPAFLAWHVLSTLAVVGQPESVRIGDSSDLTTINFAGMICVKTSAWPSS